MIAQHIKSLEMQARWIQWIESEQCKQLLTAGDAASNGTQMMARPAYAAALRTGEAFFMDSHFKALVDTAKSQIPEDLEFETEWMQTDNGFLWLEDPLIVPSSKHSDTIRKQFKKEPGLSAIAWMKVDDNSYHFLTFFDFAEYNHRAKGFGFWSYFTLRNGQKVVERIREFEKTMGDAYYRDNSGELETSHEIRWLYTAMHLMSQRVTHIAKQQTAKHIVKLGQQNKRPVVEQFRVVSLRRMVEEREKAESSGNRSFNWQWLVGGHWREQWYPSEQRHRRIFIEAYVKGPDNKPLKPVAKRLFVARR